MLVLRQGWWWWTIGSVRGTRRDDCGISSIPDAPPSPSSSSSWSSSLVRGGRCTSRCGCGWCWSIIAWFRHHQQRHQQQQQQPQPRGSSHHKHEKIHSTTADAAAAAALHWLGIPPGTASCTIPFLPGRRDGPSTANDHARGNTSPIDNDAVHDCERELRGGEVQHQHQQQQQCCPVWFIT